MTIVIWEGKCNNRDGWPWIDSNDKTIGLREAFLAQLKEGEEIHVAFTKVGEEEEE